MSENYGILSILPPLIAIFLAIISRNVSISLLTGILCGYILIENSIYDALILGLESTVKLLRQDWVLKTLIFVLSIGSIIELIKRSGGIDGLVNFFEKRKKLIKSKKEAELLPFFIGVTLFLESSITSIVAGSVSKSITDKFGTSREKLAYICDSTAAPVCTMFPLNAWGALLLGLIGSQLEKISLHKEPLTLLANALIFNFYAFFSVLLVLFTIVKGVDFKSYAKVDKSIKCNIEKEGDILALIIPIGTILISIFIFLYITGSGNIVKGSGSTSVFASVITSLFISSLYFFTIKKSMSLKEIVEAVLTGAIKMAPIALILLLAFSIGEVTSKMGTGQFLAHYANEILNPSLLPAGVFLLSAIIAFSTGTSWGTFSIMVPISITLTAMMGVADTPLLSLTIAAVISGGVFGDHASPISDTTIISSMAAECSIVSHVKTQLPWAMLAALFSIISFIVAGAVVTKL